MSEEVKHTPLPWRFADEAGAGIQIYGPIAFRANCVEFTLKASYQSLFGFTDKPAFNVTDYETGDHAPMISYERWIQFAPQKWGEMQLANAAFIVRACNAHYALLGACKIAAKRFQHISDSRRAGGIGAGIWQAVEAESCLSFLNHAIAQAEGRK